MLYGALHLVLHLVQVRVCGLTGTKLFTVSRMACCFRDHSSSECNFGEWQMCSSHLMSIILIQGPASVTAYVDCFRTT